jgi:hypothetical protein
MKERKRERRLNGTKKGKGKNRSEPKMKIMGKNEIKNEKKRRGKA